MPILFAFRDDRFGFSYEVRERAVLGRTSDCDLIIFDKAVSRLHSEIFLENGRYLIKDLGSTNGTFVNGVQLKAQQPVSLKKNDEIRLGEEVLLFDPALEVTVGSEGVVFFIGDVENKPDGLIEDSGEIKLGSLDRACMTALYKVASALSRTSRLSLAIRQISLVMERLFEADHMAVLWPASSTKTQLAVLAMRPLDKIIIIPKPMVSMVAKQGKTVIWPSVFTSLDFIDGNRILEQGEAASMASPLPVKGESAGIFYIESLKRKYTGKDLNLFMAMTALFAPFMANTLTIRELEQDIYREGRGEQTGQVSIIGEHDQIKALRAMAAQAALAGDRILIEGEEGTGKEIIARLIHTSSARKKYPFVAVNCAIYGPGYIERELFGVETEAMDEDNSPGILEMAEGGTVFLHNVNYLSSSMQIALLKAIEEGVVYRVGSIRPTPVNFQAIISATGDLKDMVDKGEFREDLYNRLTNVTLATIPLRQLGEDIILLAKHFLSAATRSQGLPPLELDPAAMECLRAYRWPGNADELKEVIDHALMFQQGNRILVEDLPLEIRLAAQAFKTEPGERTPDSVQEVEKDLIHKALAKTQGDIKLAADVLGINLDLLETSIERYDLSLDQTMTMQITVAD